jgi:cyanophycinase
MKFKSTIPIIFSFLICIQIVNAQNFVPKGKLFIIGGGERTPAMMQRMAVEAGLDKGGYAVVLPMSSEEPDSAFYYTQISLVKLGYNNIYKVFCTKEQANDKNKVDSILNAKLIYITGGDQSLFMNVVAGSDIYKAIHQAYNSGSMIGGTSAGAAVMSEIMITGNSLKNIEYASTFDVIESGNIETKPGLGMIENVIIDQHFVQRSRHNRLLTAIIEYPNMIGIGIDEATAILVTGTDAEVIGDSQVLVYGNPLKSKVEKNGKLTAKGLTLNIYLEGEHFSIK